jgi:hypothetical protein
MSLADARRVADAVLYEGYVLFPYRAKSIKSQIRWQFGVVAPRSVAELDPGERWWMQTDVLVDDSKESFIDVKLRFLRVQSRFVEAREVSEAGAETFRPVDSLTVDDRIITDWQEAIEEEVDLVDLPLAELIAGGSREIPLEYPASRSTEPITDKAGTVVGRMVRQTVPLVAVARVSAERDDSPFSIAKVRVVIENLTDFDKRNAPRDEFVQYCMAAVHTLLEVKGGQFISLADPPEFARPAVAGCLNSGTWPVLIGDEQHRNTVLSSPITLSDYPEIAPESEGDFYDATEVDEMLHLFVNTLTEEERAEARGTDPRSAAIMDRVENMPPEMMEKLHGAIRSLRSIPLPGQPALDDDDEDDGEDDDIDRDVDRGIGTGELAPFGSDFGGGDFGGGDFGGGDFDDFPTFGTDADGTVTDVRLDAETDARYKPFEDTTQLSGVKVGKGAKVRLQPGTRSDAQDMFLRGLTATVEGVFHDVDGDIHLAVSVDDDPAATELPSWIGRFRYFRIHEVEVISQ